MSDFFKWDEELYSVGVEILDEQHKKLIGLINTLFNAMKIGDSSTVIGKILNELIEYTKFHFQEEEKYMEKYNYPGIMGHKILHNKLTGEVAGIQEKMAKNIKANISIEVLDFLKDWLVNHIQAEDKKYSPYMKNS